MGRQKKKKLSLYADRGIWYDATANLAEFSPFSCKLVAVFESDGIGTINEWRDRNSNDSRTRKTKKVKNHQ
ncbi:MAG: hypothetical protein HC784_14780 [Hydrococcus sp. CSU_1_8]|nr:hypothetical protein [Hydrococcus sp. CSU_1_8]